MNSLVTMALDGSPDRRPVQTVGPPKVLQLFSGLAALAKLADLRLRQLCARAIGPALYPFREASCPSLIASLLVAPAKSAVTPLSVTVAVVVGSGSEEQMIRPDARRVVAAMADAHSHRNGTVVKLPGDSVGEILP